MGNPVVHFEIWGSDAKALTDFYGGLFDWKIDSNNPMDYGVVDAGGRASGHGIDGGITASVTGPGTLFYIEVEDPQAYLDRIVAAGGKVVKEVTEVPNMVTFALFSDPQGNVVGLVKS
jgi:predicted enzyme related to lactoylglutathione lyase